MDECRDAQINVTSKMQKRGTRSCFTCEPHCNIANIAVIWFKNSSCLCAKSLNDTLCTEILEISSSPPRTRSHKSATSSEVKRLPASPASRAAPACGTDLITDTTPSQYMVELASSFKQKRFFLARLTPHGVEMNFNF